MGSIYMTDCLSDWLSVLYSERKIPITLLLKRKFLKMAEWPREEDMQMRTPLRRYCDISWQKLKRCYTCVLLGSLCLGISTDKLYKSEIKKCKQSMPPKHEPLKQHATDFMPKEHLWIKRLSNLFVVLSGSFSSLTFVYFTQTTFRKLIKPT